MELSPGQQRLLFVVVVIVLAGLGIYLVSARHNGTAATPAATATKSPAASVAGGTAGVPPATVPPATPPTTTPGGANIYEWLPFSQADLTAAAKTTLAFAADYATWSYTEPKAAYAAKLAGLVTPQEAATLSYDYGTAGVAGTRAADKQVSTGSGSISSISSFGTGPTSITFSVAIAQQIASATAATTSSASQYAITVESTGGGWQVNDIELSGLGNP